LWQYFPQLGSVLQQRQQPATSHMDAINHMTQTHKDLRDYIAEKGMNPQRVLVLADGQSYSF
jgi:hypothetical protein